jgi:hypothetical protein
MSNLTLSVSSKVGVTQALSKILILYYSPHNNSLSFQT